MSGSAGIPFKNSSPPSGCCFWIGLQKKPGIFYRRGKQRLLFFAPSLHRPSLVTSLKSSRTNFAAFSHSHPGSPIHSAGRWKIRKTKSAGIWSGPIKADFSIPFVTAVSMSYPQIDIFSMHQSAFFSAHLTNFLIFLPPKWLFFVFCLLP